MSTKPPNAPRRCPECGAEMVDTRQRYCWLCGHKFAADGSGSPPPSAPADLPVAISVEAEERRLGRQFSLMSLFLWVTWISVVLGVAAMAPGLGGLLVLFSVPAAVAVLVASVAHRRRSGQSLSTGSRVAWFLGTLVTSLAVAALAVVAMFVALVAACFNSLPH